MVYHVLHQRTPHFAQHVLNAWYTDDGGRQRGRVVRHYLHKTESLLHLLHELNFVSKTSEFARLYGILFEEVMTRGLCRLTLFCFLCYLPYFQDRNGALKVCLFGWRTTTTLFLFPPLGWRFIVFLFKLLMLFKANKCGNPRHLKRYKLCSPGLSKDCANTRL